MPGMASPLPCRHGRRERAARSAAKSKQKMPEMCWGARPPAPPPGASSPLSTASLGEGGRGAPLPLLPPPPLTSQAPCTIMVPPLWSCCSCRTLNCPPLPSHLKPSPHTDPVRRASEQPRRGRRNALARLRTATHRSHPPPPHPPLVRLHLDLDRLARLRPVRCVLQTALRAQALLPRRVRRPRVHDRQLPPRRARLRRRPRRAPALLPLRRVPRRVAPCRVSLQLASLPALLALALAPKLHLLQLAVLRTQPLPLPLQFLDPPLVPLQLPLRPLQLACQPLPLLLLRLLPQPRHFRPRPLVQALFILTRIGHFSPN